MVGLQNFHFTSCQGVLKILAGSDDSKQKLLKAMKDWDWRPLVGALRLHCSMPKSGGNAATAHAAVAIDFLLGEDPKPEDGLTSHDKAAIQSAREGVVKAFGVETLVEVPQTISSVSPLVQFSYAVNN